MKTIQLKSFDDEIIEVSEAVARQSEVVKNILEDSNSDEILIPLPNVEGKILKKVIEWIEKHSDEELTEEEVRDWETQFVDLDVDIMYDLIMAANYLEVDALLHRACQKIADLIAGNTPEKIREIFGIENDFTPEEEAELRKQNAWVVERNTSTDVGTGTNTGTGTSTDAGTGTSTDAGTGTGTSTGTNTGTCK